MIIGENITKSYQDLQVLKGINLHIKKGEIVSIVGASGAGKTTLLQLIGTLDKPDSGNISINNIYTNELKGNELSAFRNRHIGFIFQFHQLLPEFTALENICIPAWIAKRNAKETEAEAMRLLHLLQLQDRAKHKPSELSGGEQQRVAVARALINKPSVLLADEPSGNLDSKNAVELHDLFFRLRDELGQTIVIVTHNEVLADRADRKLVMRDGIMRYEL